ncbi:hypothetical protein JZO86_17205 [Enterococcus ureasiticus]|nr:hypothetical protein [Enterococcus ureasiticus]MBO0475403.1 hypothetical protein [Enterococcus ureasiticus]
MKKLLLVVIGCLSLLGAPFQADASEVKTKNITSIEEPTWIFNSGMNK